MIWEKFIHYKPTLPTNHRAGQTDAAIAADGLEGMEKLLRHASAPSDRHRLLSALVKKIYGMRREPEMSANLYEYGRIYVEGFEQMVSPIKAASEGGQVTAPVFKQLAIAMEEDGKYEEAIALCRKAMHWELDDGTKTGFPGRIERIKKKRNT